MDAAQILQWSPGRQVRVPVAVEVAGCDGLAPAAVLADPPAEPGSCRGELLATVGRAAARRAVEDVDAAGVADTGFVVIRHADGQVGVPVAVEVRAGHRTPGGGIHRSGDRFGRRADAAREG